MRLFLFTIVSILINSDVFAQGCCSGGAGSPIAGGASTGVLNEYQMEISLNYQFNQSDQFYNEDVKSTPLFENLSTDYLFFRTDYGVSKKLTLSLATGYYLNKELIETDNIDTTSNSGLSDLIILPRYSVYNKNTNFKRTEIALGIGVKIPLGYPNDSSISIPISSWNPSDIYQMSPPTIQTTNGSHDFMFYSFLYREYQKNKLRFFVNTLYVKKSFNSLGVKFGDYSSIGFFASKTFLRKWGVTTQIKAERIGQIQAAENIDLLGFYNIDPISTGSKKWFFIPQISYSSNGFTFFATGELPVYQYLNGTQIGSESQLTFGVNYRFLIKGYDDQIM